MSSGLLAPVEDPLWRGVDVFRTATFGYAALVCVDQSQHYARPWLGWVGIALMGAWTALFWLRPRRTRGLVVADLVVACVLIAATALVETPDRIAAGAQTLPTVWAATPVISWAIWRGSRVGVLAAGCVAVVDMLVTGRVGGNTLHNNFLLLLVGGIIGYCADLFRRGHQALREALAVDAATAERERLARDIHDSVLQVLAFVQRRAREIGGDTEELGRLAGEQEHRLRTLVSGRGRALRGGSGQVDLCALLRSSARVGGPIVVVAPAGPVALARERASELLAAVEAALDNVLAHAGPAAKAWVLLEDEGQHVQVTVRDDGVGFAAGRLEQAQAAGRLGVALSVCGRVGDLGGSTQIRSAPGEGTEVTLRIPRRVGT